MVLAIPHWFIPLFEVGSFFQLCTCHSPRYPPTDTVMLLFSHLLLWLVMGFWNVVEYRTWKDCHQHQHTPDTKEKERKTYRQRMVWKREDIVHVRQSGIHREKDGDREDQQSSLVMVRAQISSCRFTINPVWWINMVRPGIGCPAFIFGRSAKPDTQSAILHGTC